MNEKKSFSLDNYPKLELDYITNFSYRRCAKCKRPFWNFSDKVLHCADLDCNSEDLELKNLVISKKELLSQTIDNFKNFFLSKRGYASNSVVLNRPSSLLKISSTNMNFLTAGISSFESLLSESNYKLKKFNNIIFISSPFVFRFYDNKRVGVTKRHCSGFFMLSLQCFEHESHFFPYNWKQQILKTVVEYYLSLGIPLKNLYLHGDKWSDGNNYGPSVEIFVNGIELGNIVYTCYNNDNTRKLKFLDIGLGAQRINSLLGNENLYASDTIRDTLRSILIAIKDGHYPGKTGSNYNIRKKLEELFENNLYKNSDFEPKLEAVLKDLESCTKESFKGTKQLYYLIMDSELKRYSKAKSKGGS